MAKDLGLFVLETTRSYIDTTDVLANRLQQVRSELNMTYLHNNLGPDTELIDEWRVKRPHAASYR